VTVPMDKGAWSCTRFACATVTVLACAPESCCILSSRCRPVVSLARDPWSSICWRGLLDFSCIESDMCIGIPRHWVDQFCCTYATPPQCGVGSQHIEQNCASELGTNSYTLKTVRPNSFGAMWSTFIVDFHEDLPDCDLSQDAKNMTGPTLHGLFGRQVTIVVPQPFWVWVVWYVGPVSPVVRKVSAIAHQTHAFQTQTMSQRQNQSRLKSLLACENVSQHVESVACLTCPVCLWSLHRCAATIIRCSMTLAGLAVWSGRWIRLLPC